MPELLIVDGPAIAARYRAWDESGVGGQDPLESLDAANECKHERLPGDRTLPCGCFPGIERNPTPEEVRMYEDELDDASERMLDHLAVPTDDEPEPSRAARADERIARELSGVDIDAAVRAAERESEAPTPEPVHAPFGFKADGTPRKRPAPSRAVIEAAAEGRRRARQRRQRGAEPAPAATRVRVTANAGPKANPDFIAQMVTSLEAEIEREIASNPTLKRLLAARDKLREVTS